MDSLRAVARLFAVIAALLLTPVVSAYGADTGSISGLVVDQAGAPVADAMIHSTEKSMKDLGDKVSAGDKSRVEAAISELREALKAAGRSAVKVA